MPRMELKHMLNLAVALLVPAAILHAAGTAKPNFILIMADDMGFSDIGCYGSEIQTPNIDRLAREGMRFTQFYNNAKCTTTRASLLSGMYPRASGNSIPREIPTIGETMRALGYQTGMSGKWHLGNRAPQRPFDRGFDEYYGLMGGATNFFNPAQLKPGGKFQAFGHNDQLITTFPPGYYTTDAFAEHAITTITRFVKEGKPFFLHLAFNAPHYPLHAFPEDIAKYRGKYRKGWGTLREERYARLLKMGIVNPKWKQPPADSKSYDWATANQDWEDLRMATYAAMVDRMDQNIGRLLASLKDLGIDDNTVVMFLSDNGGCTEEPDGRDDTQQPGIVSTYTAVGPAWGAAQNTPFRRYKSWMNEGGVSTPFIVRWPAGIKAGAMTNQIGHVIDVLPTCVELSGAKVDAKVEGRSLAAVLRGGQRTAPEKLFWEWGGNCAMRQGKWKLVWDTLNIEKAWQLYDIEADRTEMNDLAKQQPDRVQQMKADYLTWANQLGRKVPGLPSSKSAR